MVMKTLLPTSSVHVFSPDDYEKNLVKNALHDWRTARVSMDIGGDDLDAAIARYSQEKSPSLVIIKTDDIGTEFQEKLTKLADLCAEDTSALVIGPVNDVKLYRKLTDMGVSDYLVDPVSKADFIEAIAKALLSMLGTSDSRLISFIGAKGGQGTTTMAHLAALALSENLGQKCFLMDAAAGRSTLWSQFGTAPTGTTIEAAKAAVDRDQEALGRLLHNVNDRLAILNTGVENILDHIVSAKAYEMLLDRMLALYPVVLVDLSGAPEVIQRNTVARSHAVFMVTTPRIDALSLARSMVEEVRGVRGGDDSVLNLIINQGGGNQQFMTDIDIARALSMDRFISMPANAKFFIGQETSDKPISASKQGQAMIAQMVEPLADICGLEHQATGQSHTIIQHIKQWLGSGDVRKE